MKHTDAMELSCLTDVKTLLETVGRMNTRVQHEDELWLYIIDRGSSSVSGLWLWKYGGCESIAEYFGDELSLEPDGYVPQAMNACSSASAGADVAIDVGSLAKWLFSYKTVPELIREGLIIVRGDVMDKVERAALAPGNDIGGRNR